MKSWLKKLSAMTVSCAMAASLFTACGHEHEWSDWEVDEEASCVKAGEKIRTCDCGEEQTKKIPTQGHEAGEWIVDREATCSKTGKRHLECQVCGEVIQQEDDVPATTYSSTEIHEMYEDSVGAVTTYDRSGYEYALGTCFVYSADGKLITNYHVIEDAYSVEVDIAGKTYKVESVLAYDKDVDVAVLKISAKKLKPVTICEKTHKVGEVVYAFGNSKGLENTFSDGMITYAEREVDGVLYTQHDAPISGGNSGGPLINAYGEVIGINTWTVRDSQNLNFAISMSELDDLDYSEELTMEELFNKESNAFVKLRNYIINEGSYSTSLEGYSLTLDYNYSSDYSTKYTYMAYYFDDDQTISLDLYTDDGEYWVYFEIDESLDGRYYWKYFDDDDRYMYGTLYAGSFTDNTDVSYSSTNIYNSTIKNAVIGMSSAMVSLILLNLEENSSDIGITPADLGFVNF